MKIFIIALLGISLLGCGDSPEFQTIRADSEKDVVIVINPRTGEGHIYGSRQNRIDWRKSVTVQDLDS